MTITPTPPAPHDPSPFRSFGFWGLVTGVLALVFVFIVVLGPTLQPQPSVGTQIGEIAGEMKRAAWRSFFGLEQPAPEVVKPTLMDYLAFVPPVLGGIALLLAVVSGVKGENWRYSVYGATIGGSAIVFYFFWWVAMVVVGVLLLVAIIENLGDFFSFGG
ncbi:MAG: hypothetical protein AAFY90_01660 [Pseudomonadota bacterium]